MPATEEGTNENTNEKVRLSKGRNAILFWSLQLPASCIPFCCILTCHRPHFDTRPKARREGLSPDLSVAICQREHILCSWTSSLFFSTAEASIVIFCFAPVASCSAPALLIMLLSGCAPCRGPRLCGVQICTPNVPPAFHQRGYQVLLQHHSRIIFAPGRAQRGSQDDSMLDAPTNKRRTVPDDSSSLLCCQHQFIQPDGSHTANTYCTLEMTPSPASIQLRLAYIHAASPPLLDAVLSLQIIDEMGRGYGSCSLCPLTIATRERGATWGNWRCTMHTSPTA